MTDQRGESRGTNVPLGSLFRGSAQFISNFLRHVYFRDKRGRHLLFCQTWTVSVQPLHVFLFFVVWLFVCLFVWLFGCFFSFINMYVSCFPISPSSVPLVVAFLDVVSIPTKIYEEGVSETVFSDQQKRLNALGRKANSSRLRDDEN